MASASAANPKGRGRRKLQRHNELSVCRNGAAAASSEGTARHQRRSASAQRRGTPDFTVRRRWPRPNSHNPSAACGGRASPQSVADGCPSSPRGPLPKNRRGGGDAACCRTAGCSCRGPSPNESGHWAFSAYCCNSATTGRRRRCWCGKTASACDRATATAAPHKRRRVRTSAPPSRAHSKAAAAARGGGR